MATTRANPIVDMDRLLPSVYRVNDEDFGRSLEALLDVIGSQADALKVNIDQLWDDFFIETCADWVIPYIGDLVGNRALRDAAVRRRADVARTIHYRRRKGTLPMLEQMAAAVTGWGLHAVAAFELLSWTQNLNHLRTTPAPFIEPYEPNDPVQDVDAQVFDRVGTVNLRNVEALWRLNGPFDFIAHSVDVRQSPGATISAPPPSEPTDRGVDQAQGWFGIRNVLFFMWRIASFRLSGVTARSASATSAGFHFSPIGNPAPLFALGAPVHDDAVLVEEWEIPGPIRPAAFFYDTAHYYPISFEITTTKTGVPTTWDVASIACRDLIGWQEPPAGTVAVDVARGRMRFNDADQPDSVTVTYCYGSCASMGGGPYERRGRTFDGTHDSVAQSQVPVAGWRLYPVGATATFVSVGAALAQWNADGNPDAVIEIKDSATYQENVDIGITDTTLIIQGANRQRPTLIGNVVVTGSADAGEVRLDGLLIAGQLVVNKKLGVLALGHCTFVPGLDLDEAGHPVHPNAASIVLGSDDPTLQVTIDHCITGALRTASAMGSLVVVDSIVDAVNPTRLTPALLSGQINAVPTQAGSFDLRIGDRGPFTVDVAKPNPATLVQAAANIEAGIRASHDAPGFTDALVLTIDGKRLVIVPGEPAAVTVTAHGVDTTASDLKLDAASSSPTTALVGEELAIVPDLTQQGGSLVASLPSSAWQVTLAKTADTLLSTIASSLQTALRGLAGAGLSAVAVQAVGNQLLVVSGDGAPLPAFVGDSTADLPYRLGITPTRPAIASHDGPYGPRAQIERTTVVGETYVREVNASEVIFSGSVQAERTQAGCMRFSYVPVGSRTPRKFHCQPQDDTDDTLAALVRPVFESLRYGDPAYGQLDLVCAAEIRLGAEDGSEMGAYSSLKQPQRESGLLLRLQEYLPVARQPGLVYVN